MKRLIQLALLGVLVSSPVEAKKCKKFRSIAVQCQAMINNLIAQHATVGGIPFGSLLAYAYTTNLTPGTVIADNEDLIFERANSLASSNVTFSPSTPDFTTITVPAGTYLFAYSVSATGTIFAGNSLSFALFNHTTGMIVPSSQYNSEEIFAIPLLTKGYGIAQFSQQTTLSLRNESTQPVSLILGAFAIPDAVINSLILIRIAA